MAAITTAVMCLALNVYFEARSEPIKGQQAVAHVTLIRARERNMRVCDVVFEPAQFSWTISDPKVTNEKAWAAALKVAQRAYRRKSTDPTGGANHYHADYVKPRTWDFAKLTRTATIGRHVFYTNKPTQLARAGTTKEPV
jgi:spore germination cell wall hydrolase CwlJ-like protein